MHLTHATHILGDVRGLLLQLVAGDLAGQQHHAVVGVHVDVGIIEAGIGLAEIDLDLGLDALVFHLGAQGAIAIVFVDRAAVGQVGDGGAAG